MIKNLRLKFVLVFLVLAVGVFTVSSCYADDITKFNDIGLLSDYGIEELTVDNISKNKFYNGSSYGTGISGWVSGNVDDLNNGTAKMLYFKYNGYDFCFLAYDYKSNAGGIGYQVRYSTYYFGLSGKNCSSYLYVWNPSTKNWHWTMGNPTIADTSSSNDYFSSVNFNNSVLDLYCVNSTADYVIANLDGNYSIISYTYLFDASEYVPPAAVKVKHEFNADTSAKVTFDYSSYGFDYVLKYSLSGIEINTDLTAPVTLKNPIVYSPGISNLVVSPNTKVYWVLYDSNGDSVDTDIYQVPEYDAVIENSDKEIEYEIVYSEDYTSATLNVNVVNGVFSDKLYYSKYGLISNDYEPKMLFPISSGLEIKYNCNLHLILYDSLDNIISAKYVTIDKISTIPMDNFKVNVLTEEKTVILYPRLYNVLQSKFYDIEYDINVDSWTANKKVILYENGEKIGNIFDLSGTRSCHSDFELKFFQNIGTSNITITFRVINSETGATCITRTVSFKIGLKDEDTGVTDSTTNGDSDSSFIISDNSFNSGGYSKVSWKDITNTINTNGDFWQIIKAILNCFPAWVTAPIFFFISAIVTICLTKLVLNIVGHLVG